MNPASHRASWRTEFVLQRIGFVLQRIGFDSRRRNERKTSVRPLRRRSTINRYGLFALIALMVSVGSVRGENWPGFHGLQIAGALPEASLPAAFSKQEYRWTVDLGTRDVGSMAVQDGRVYLLAMSADRPVVRLIAFDLETGKETWSKEFPQAKNHLHSRNTLASSTPATDSDYVYVAHSDREHTWLRCLNHDGDEVWTRDFGTAQSQHGFGTSPTVHDDIVLLNFSQQASQIRGDGKPGTSKVIAVNRSNGETIWETPVTSTRVCYGVPVVQDGKVICANTGDGVYALSLDTGKMLWRLPVFRMRCVSTPIVVGDIAIGSSGSGGGGNHLVAVRIPKQDSGKPEEIYRIERNAPYVPTSVVHEGAMFVIDDRGVASWHRSRDRRGSLDQANRRELWCVSRFAR